MGEESRRRLSDRRTGDASAPAEEATKDEAHAAVKAMRVVRAFVRQRLGLTDEVKQ
jgi:hypothetical protein